MTSCKKFNIADYCEYMEQVLGGQEGPARVFWEALSFAVSAHQDQRRKSGEVYVSHPLQVAKNVSVQQHHICFVISLLMCNSTLRRPLSRICGTAGRLHSCVWLKFWCPW